MEEFKALSTALYHLINTRLTTKNGLPANYQLIRGLKPII